MKNIFPIKINKGIKLRGFTLIETLVAVFVITTVILGPLTIASTASAYARQTKDTMTAIYLAQEAMELLHHQQDSFYLRCISQSSTTCVPNVDETPSEAAWRMFRDSLGDIPPGPSCYVVDNPLGCAYDFLDMAVIGNGNITSTKYSLDSGLCSTLSTSTSTVDRYGYVCTGIHGQDPGYIRTNFSRSIKIVSLKTFSGADENYNDDLRVTVTVSFKRATGYTREIKVVNFLHSRS